MATQLLQPQDVFNTVLDISQEEAYYWYRVVKNLLQLPDFYEQDYPEPKGVIYSLAVAYLCHDYLVAAAGMNEHEDFDFVIDQLQFESIFEQWDMETPEQGFVEYVREEVADARENICKRISEVFPTRDLQLKLFASLFDEGFDGDYSRALSFVNNNLKQQ